MMTAEKSGVVSQLAPKDLQLDGKGNTFFALFFREQILSDHFRITGDRSILLSIYK